LRASETTQQIGKRGSRQAPPLACYLKEFESVFRRRLVTAVVVLGIGIGVPAMMAIV
jgi:hypothetical protein